MAGLRILGQPRYPNSPGPPAVVAPLIAQQADAISWGKQKALHWLKILDLRLIGPHNNYLCGVTIALADYQNAEIISLGDLIRCEYSNFPNVSRWMNTMRSLQS